MAVGLYYLVQRTSVWRCDCSSWFRGLVCDGVFVLPVQGESGLDGPHGEPGPKGNLGRGVCDIMCVLERWRVCVIVLANERETEMGCVLCVHICVCVCVCVCVSVCASK